MKNKHIFLITIILTMSAVLAHSQYDIIWNKKFGGEKDEDVRGLLHTSSGNYTIFGRSKSDNGTFDNNYGEYDGFILQLNKDGDLTWQKNYGGSKSDAFHGCLELSDHTGYILWGLTSSDDFDLVSDSNNIQIQEWVVSISPTGEIIYSTKYFKEDQRKSIINIQHSPSNEIIIASQYLDTLSDQTILEFESIDIFGSSFWKKEITLPNRYSVTQYQFINDSTILLGANYNTDPNSNENVLIAEANIDKDSIQWLQVYGGDKDDIFINFIRLDDYTLVYGRSESYAVNPSNPLNFDYWIFKINNQGDKIWQKLFGSNSSDLIQDLDILENSILLSGTSFGNDLDVSNSYGFGDIWLVEIDYDGNLINEQSLGGSRGDGPPFTIPQCKGEEIILLSDTNSEDFDVPPGPFGGSSNKEIWLTKLRRTDRPQLSEVCTATIYPNPATSKDLLNIIAPDTFLEDIIDIQLYDSAGRLISSLTDSKDSFSITCEQQLLQINPFQNTQLPSGIYFLNIQDTQKSCTYKVFLGE